MLKEILREKGLKQLYVAEKMGVSIVTFSNWVTGKSHPSKKHLEKLSEVLDVPQKELMNL